MTRPLLALICAVTLTAPLAAKDSLGVYSSWAAFRDENPHRCYAIAKPVRGADTGPFASIGNWPQSRIRGQLHIRLSRSIREGASVTLRVGTRNFTLAANGRNAWAQDTAMDAAVVAEMRSATRMSVTSRDSAGRRFTDRYDLAGAATAIDAATVGCASR